MVTVKGDERMARHQKRQNIGSRGLEVYFCFLMTMSHIGLQSWRITHMHCFALLLRDHHRCIMQRCGCDRYDTGGCGRRIVIDQSNRVDDNRSY